MFDTIFADAALWMQSNILLALGAAFVWGLGSVVFSPCHLAAIPVMALHASGYLSAPGEDAPTVANANASAGAGFANTDAHRPSVHDNAQTSALTGDATSNSGQASGTARAKTSGIVTSVCFALGYFLAIAGLGVLCALLGRIVDVEALGGEYWLIPAGLILLWFGRSLWREHNCSQSHSGILTLGRRLGLKAGGGAVVLGGGYGFVSSGCTLAFLTPVLVLGLTYSPWACAGMGAAFALGHCLPMALVGFMPVLTQKLMYTCRLDGFSGNVAHGQEHEHKHAHAHKHPIAEQRFRKLAAVVIMLAGLVLILHPFFE